MLVETFLRKQLGLKSHKVTKVEETEQYMIVHIDRLGRRLLRCGVCRQRCRKVHSVRRPREWRDLSMRKVRLKLRYRPRRVECPRCGLRVEDLPWADPWGMDRFCLLGLNVPGAAVIGVLMGAAVGYSVTPAALRAHRREKAPGHAGHRIVVDAQLGASLRA